MNYRTHAALKRGMLTAAVSCCSNRRNHGQKPTNLKSNNTSFEFNIDKANQILDQAGYARGADGIRVTPNGVPMKVLFQTTVNSLRQKEQVLVKDGWQKIGIETELKPVDARGVFLR